MASLKIFELLPSAEEWKQFRDIESSLVRRRVRGKRALFVVIASAALQFLQVAAKRDFEKILSLDNRWALLAWAVLLGAAVVWYQARYTGVLLQESKEAFRYTFSIEPFKVVENSPSGPLESSNGFALLHHDLTERLAQRIKRFSVLEEAGNKEAEDSGGSSVARTKRYASHIHISSHFALREDEDSENKNKNNWVIHLMPLVQIGPPGSPATVAEPVKYRCARDGESQGTCKLDVLGYRQIVERVYSSVATEVYKRIEEDVRAKIELFPTTHLRTIALYHEAEDFARSNTVDAYERALELYQRALDYFEQDSLNSSVEHRFVRATTCAIRLVWQPIHSVRRLARGARYDQEWARVASGYAKCLIYRHAISALTGREGNPLYGIPELLRPPMAALERRYKPSGTHSTDPRLTRLLAWLHEQGSQWLPRATRRERLEVRKNALFELYVVSALSSYFLEQREQSLNNLEDAAATAPDRVAKDPLYLVVKGLLEPVVDKAILRYCQAVEIAPDFQVAQWFLANACERQFRREDEITRDRAKRILQEYERVLTINCGNIAALSALGCLHWMVGNRDEARRRLEEGRQVKAIVSETFVGELTYRLARLAAEEGKFEECRDLYAEAAAADPNIGAVVPDPQGRILGDDYDYVEPSMLQRFETYKEGVEGRISHEHSFVGPPERGKAIPGRTLDIVHAFVLNDYANACLRYFHHHGDHFALKRAIEAYEQATQVDPTDARPWFNLQYAYYWTEEFDKINHCYEMAVSLAPTWTSAAIRAAKYRVVQFARESPTEQEVRVLDDELHELEKKARELLENRSRDARSQSTRPGVQPGAKGAAIEGVSSGRKSGEHQRNAEVQPSKQRRLQSEIETKKSDLENAKNKQDELLRLVEHARKEIAENSRLKLLWPRENLPGATAPKAVSTLEQVKQITSIPRRKLAGQDVQNMIHFAEVLAWTVDTEELKAAEALAAHLLELTPDKLEVSEVLLNVVPKLPEKKSRCDLLERAKQRRRDIVTNWLESDPQVFLALYEYGELWKETDEAGRPTGRVLESREIRKKYGGLVYTPEDIQEKYFAQEPEKYESLSGWVAFAEEHYADAVAAFARAIELDSRITRGYLGLRHFGKQLGDGRVEPVARIKGHLPQHDRLEKELDRLEKELDRLETRAETRAKTRRAAFECYGMAATLSPIIDLSIRYGMDIYSLLGGSRSGGQDRELERRYESVREDIDKNYGVRLPDATWRLSYDVPGNCFLVDFQRVRVTTGDVEPGRKFCLIRAEEWSQAGLPGIPARDPLGEAEAVWLSDKQLTAVPSGKKCDPLDPLDYVLRHIEAVLLSRLHSFLGYQQIVRRLGAGRVPRISAIAASPDETRLLTQMLRALLAERASISDFENLCELFRSRDVNARPGAVIEDMRMLPLTRERLWGNADDFNLVSVGPRFADQLRAKLIDTGTWYVLTVELAAQQDMLKAVRGAIAAIPRPAIVVEDSALRIHVTKLIELEFPEVPVLAQRELANGLTIAAKPKIELDEVATYERHGIAAGDEAALQARL